MNINKMIERSIAAQVEANEEKLADAVRYAARINDNEDRAEAMREIILGGKASEYFERDVKTAHNALQCTLECAGDLFPLLEGEISGKSLMGLAFVKSENKDLNSVRDWCAEFIKRQSDAEVAPTGEKYEFVEDDKELVQRLWGERDLKAIRKHLWRWVEVIMYLDKKMVSDQDWPGWEIVPRDTFMRPEKKYAEKLVEFRRAYRNRERMRAVEIANAIAYMD